MGMLFRWGCITKVELLNQFSPLHYFPIFFRIINMLYQITLILDRCRRSWAAETPGKYERDLNYLTYTFAKSKVPVMMILTNGALVTRTPGALS